MNSHPNKRRRFPNQNNNRGGRGGGRGNHSRRPQHTAAGRGGAPVVDTSRIEERGTPSDTTLSVAVLGCCHGELGAVYDRIAHHEKETGSKVDLLVCCGDFQSLRSWEDFHSLAVPPKYRNSLGSFLPYYIGAKRAPLPTIVIGGNHESSQALQELYYGGWLAPQIFYLGAAGVVRYRGLRIGGLTGIFKGYNYRKPHWERPPYDSNSLRSVYHVRHVDVARLLSLSPPSMENSNLNSESPTVPSDTLNSGRRLDIMLSHDWPRGIEHHGNLQGLLRKKPFFREDIKNNELGNPAGYDILSHLKPRHWFAAHLHVQFEATVRHKNNMAPTSKVATFGMDHNDVPFFQTPTSSTTASQLTPSQVIKALPVSKLESPDKESAEKTESEKRSKAKLEEKKQSVTTNFLATESRDPCVPDLTDQMTRFLALDKCLPRKPYLSIIRVPGAADSSVDGSEPKLEYDAEWLTILLKTHSWTSSNVGAPVTVSAAEMEATVQQLGSLVIPENFTPTVPLLPESAATERIPYSLPPPFPQMGNPQTDEFLHRLGLEHCSSGITIPCLTQGTIARLEQNDPNAIDIEDDSGAADAAPGISEGDDNEIDLDEEEKE
eukprot:scaffold1581_cov169-Amphora_coffeaeformis.AAC.26